MLEIGRIIQTISQFLQVHVNFASSPARILIDFIDPLIVAENISSTDRSRFVTIRDFEKDLRDGQKGISGIGSMGKGMLEF